MTHEILDCLWIKALFIRSNQRKLLADIESEEDIERLCNSIFNILTLEGNSFFYVCDDFIEKLSMIVATKRFEGQHTRELIDKFNMIIDVVNTYKQLSQDEKNIVISAWSRKEAEYHRLPYYKLGGYDSLDIKDILLLDYYFAPFLFYDNYEKVECEFGDFLNTINLLISRYSYIFQERPDVFCKCMSICMNAEEESATIRRRAKKTKALLMKFE